MGMLIAILLSLIAGFVAGYSVCTTATWGRVHRQESYIRALVNDVAVSIDMGEPVPAEWMQDQLESMLAQEFR